MRKFVFAVVLLLGIVFIIGRFAELQSLIETVQRGDWHYLILALIIETAWIMNLAASYHTIFNAMGIDEKVENVLLIATAANFATVAAPSVGMSGIAVFISEARRRNFSTARAAIAGALQVFFDYLGFIVMLFLGLIVLIRRNNLTTIEIVSSVILVTIAIVFFCLLYLGVRSGDALGKALAWMARLVNRLVYPFTHRQYLSEDRAHEFAHDAAEGLCELRRKPRNILLPAGLALVNKILLVSILFFVFLAFKVPVSAGTIVAGFSIGYLFVIASPTPAGLGIVEGVMTIYLRSMYVPWGDAAVITLVYRGFTFWVPLLVGMIAFRMLGRSTSSQSKNASDDGIKNVDSRSI